MITIVVSWTSYRWVETPLGKYSREHTIKILGITALVALITTATGLALYARAGVVRDIPELDVYINNIHRGMHAEYCDRVYKMESDFENNGKTKVIAIGDSYARDFVNVLLESKYKDSLDIRYIYPHGKLTEVEKQRIKQADIVFIRACYSINNMQPYFASVRELCSDKPFYGIGTKEYGISNGDVYQRKNQADYYQTKVQMSTNYQKEYKNERIYWGKQYVDFVGAIADENGLLPVFTDERKYISQDCRHLTRAGAKYYARILPLEQLLVKQTIK